jgi:hypothetical protein
MRSDCPGSCSLNVLSDVRSVSISGEFPHSRGKKPHEPAHARRFGLT